MKSDFDFVNSPDFNDKSSKEMLEEFLDSCPVVSGDVYANFYGAYFPAMIKILPTSAKVFLWMVFNVELNNGRVIIQSLAVERLLKECEISRVAYFNSLRDLKKHNVIRGCRAVYYINPQFAWRGTYKHRRLFMEQYPYIQNERLTKNGTKTAEF